MNVKSAIFVASFSLLAVGSAHAVDYRDGTWDQSLVSCFTLFEPFSTQPARA